MTILLPLTTLELDVPLYLHPAPPPEAVMNVYYGRLPKQLGALLSTAGFGWHIEVAVHILRLAISGTFDRYPKLKIIIGHMGETLPFMLERAQQVFSSTKVDVKSILQKHLWLTTSGFFTTPPFLTALQTFGADRIMYSVDYPFANPEIGWKFLERLPVSESDRIKIASGNADKLLKLKL